ncbi:hypothetical protein ACLB2K_052690 [Fragaria x ananassa]
MPSTATFGTQTTEVGPPHALRCCPVVATSPFYKNQGTCIPKPSVPHRRTRTLLPRQVYKTDSTFQNKFTIRLTLVGETGWPSKGDDDELGASLENAAIYNGNLLKRQMAKEGAPLKPNLDVYIFALFNENIKSRPTSETFVPGFDRVIFIG